MTQLYTKNGRPLQHGGDQLWSRSGIHFGRIQSRYAFDSSSQHAGTSDGDCVVYRAVDSAHIASLTFAAPASVSLWLLPCL